MQVRLILVTFLLSLTLVCPVAAAPATSAASAVLMDGDTGRILYAQDENTPRPMASTTKLMTALEAVPKEYEDASLALGATPIETYFRVSVPAAKSGIAAAVVLGVGRANGEAMAVMMVSGNAPNMPSLFESVRFLTTAVASEMSYASGLQRQALFSIALVLYVFIMLINIVLNVVLKGGDRDA